MNTTPPTQAPDVEGAVPTVLIGSDGACYLWSHVTHWFPYGNDKVGRVDLTLGGEVGNSTEIFAGDDKNAAMAVSDAILRWVTNCTHPVFDLRQWAPALESAK